MELAEGGGGWFDEGLMAKCKVLLLGDAVRVGYQPVVQRELEGGAQVIGPEEPCGNTVETLGILYKWVAKERPQFVHVNCGLADLRTVSFAGTDNLVLIDHYRANLERIFHFITSQSSARVVWCSTTPVDDKLCEMDHSMASDFQCYNKDVLLYNQAAQEVALRRGFLIHDLYAKVAQGGGVKAFRPDGVHFKPEGYEWLGGEVASVLRPLIGG